MTRENPTQIREDYKRYLKEGACEGEYKTLLVQVHWWLFWKRNEFLCSTEQEMFLTHVTINLQESFCSLCLLLYIEMLSGNYGLQCHNRSRNCI